jgi:dTDP-4-amino-4,6-dideoxygalactose transaminase
MRREIPFFDYTRLYRDDEAFVRPAIEDVLRRGAFILQSDLADFEADLAAFAGVRHAIGVANGTDALVLALRAAGVGADHEVIVPSHTYVASAAAVHFVGAKPVLVDCGPDHLVDPAAVREAVNRRTRAVIPVHLNGRTAEMNTILDIAHDNDLLVIEDAAQAVGSMLNDRAAGTFGVAGTYSFYPAKILGCFGDGGAIVTNDDDIAFAVRLLRDHGRDDTGVIVGWGLNSRLDNIQAAVLRVKLARLHQAIERRRQVARQYCERLSGVGDMVLPPGPDADSGRYDVYQNFEVETGERDQLREYLRQAGIHTIVQWNGHPVHQLKGLELHANLPMTELLFERCFLLPMNPYLSDADVDYICAMIRKYFVDND